MGQIHPSSTSSSDPVGTRSPSWRSLGVFFAVLAGTTVIFALAWRAVPRSWRATWVGDSFRVTERTDDQYPVELEDEVHLFGLDPVVVQSMRAADVLIVGNSRTQLGLLEPQLGAFFRAQSLRYYYLCFGYGEPAPFCEEIIRRYDLHPRWVIANADGYFRAKPGIRGREVLDLNWLQLCQERIELGASLALLPPLHHWYPRFTPQRQIKFWRSRTTGAWVERVAAPEGTPFPAAAAPRLAESASTEVSAAAAEFKKVCDRIGARLILTEVPSPAPLEPPGTTEYLARRLGVLLCLPHVDGLRSFDSSHVTNASGKVFTAAFLAELPRVAPELVADHGPSPR